MSIFSIDELFDPSTNSQLTSVIRGHLIIEFFLIKLIECGLENSESLSIDRLNFPNKVDLCSSLGIIDKKLSKYLKEVNSLRNKFAHQIDFTISQQETYQLIKKASNIGILFTDAIDEDEEFFYKHYTSLLSLNTLFRNTVLYLSDILNEKTGSSYYL